MYSFSRLILLTNEPRASTVETSGEFKRSRLGYTYVRIRIYYIYICAFLNFYILAEKFAGATNFWPPPPPPIHRQRKQKLALRIHQKYICAQGILFIFILKDIWKCSVLTCAVYFWKRDKYCHIDVIKICKQYIWMFICRIGIFFLKFSKRKRKFRNTILQKNSIHVQHVNLLPIPNVSLISISPGRPSI